MKNIFLTLTLLLSAYILQAQIVNIPDAYFKNALVNENVADLGNGILVDVDTNNDGEIQINEAEAVIRLEINEKNISSLDGIEYFINLERLICYSNNITILDLSNNLNLEYLDCYGNQITDLNLTQNINLEGLYCSNNPLVNLDLSQNSNLTRLYCQYNSQLNFLNIKNGNNQAMDTMMARNNPSLNCIQVDDNNAYYPQCDLNNFKGWCRDQGVVYSENCTLGVTNFDLYNVKIFPNPVEDILNVSTEFPINHIKIYTLQGQLINETTGSQIDVSLLTPGLYFVSVIIDGENNVKKFIKN